jgi:hypothetical protein
MAAAALVVAAALATGGAAFATRGSDPVARPTPLAAAPTSAPGVAPTVASVAPSPSGPVSGDTVSLAAVGDVIMGSTPKLPPDGARTFFDDVRPQLRGDLVMGNFEGALTDLTTSTKCRQPPQASAPPKAVATPRSQRVPPRAVAPSPPGEPNRCFAFRMPPAYAQVLRNAGFGVLNLANNHTRDYGAQGLASTRSALTAAGVLQTGAPGQITMVTVRGVRVAVLGFAPYSWTQSVVDVGAAKALVAKAAQRADIVVVNMHAGGEGADRTHVRPGTEMFLGENRGDPMRFARAVIDAGADIVVGHSPHVLRGMEWYKGRLIAYSMGNFAGYRTLSSSGPMGVGGVLHVTLRKDGTWVRGALVGTRMVNGGLPALDRQNRAYALVNALSAADFGASAARIAASGEITTA